MDRALGIGSVVGRFRLDRRIGMGGMGVVYAATDLHLGRRVAVKVMSSRFVGDRRLLARFDRETTTLARMDSPHVVTILDHGLVAGAPYLVTQLVAGGDLGTLIERRGPLPPALAAEVCAQVADALADAHRAGVVHRDVKPGNVLLEDPDADRVHAFLCDFGIAHTGDGELTAPGAVAGTWAYLAPELADGQVPTPLADVYALGCLLCEALTGGPPYAGSGVDVALAHRAAPVPQLPAGDSLHRRLNRVLRTCLAKDPQERYAAVGQARDDLREAVRAARARARAPGRPRSGVRRAMALGAAAVVLGAGAVALWPDGTDPAPSPLPPVDPSPTAAPSPTVDDATGDLDGDGHGDLRLYRPAGSGSGRTQLTWRHGGSTWQGPERAKAPPGRLLRGDVDGDDRPDVLTLRTEQSSPGRPTLVVTVGGGEERATFTGPETTGAVLAPGVGDYDGDGDDDLALATRGQEGVEIWVMSSSEGRLGVAKRWYRDEAPRSGRPLLHPGDFDGDGDDDLALETRSGHDARVSLSPLKTRGPGSFVSSGTPAQLTVQPGETLTVIAGDPDGDGDAELVVHTLAAFESGGRAQVLEPSPDGFAAPEHWIRVQGARHYFDGWSARVTLLDANGDGRDDLARVGGVFQDEFWLVDTLLSDGERFQQPGPANRFRCGHACDLGSVTLLGAGG